MNLRKRLARLALPVGVGALLAMATFAAAFADSTTASTTITGGSLSETVSSTPTVVATLNGTNQTPSYTLPITADDNTGTGSGWNLTVTSTQFTTGGATPHTLATSASEVTGVTSACAQGTCTNPTNSITYPVGVPAGATPPAGAKLFDAAVNSGMGDFTETPAIQLSIPANTYAGTYTSTVTLSIVSGP